jgi:hypothetical protein
MDNVFASYDYENMYEWSKIISYKHFTKLMYLVTNNRKYGNGVLQKYILENKKKEQTKKIMYEGPTTILTLPIRSRNPASLISE